MDNLIYLAILIILSLISGAWKKKNKEQDNTPPDTSLEDEIRRMAERMMGKTEEQKSKPVEKPAETYRPLAEERRQSPYRNYDEEAGYETNKPYESIPTEPIVDYSERDIRRVQEQYEGFKNISYTTEHENYEQKYLDALQRGREQHSLMEKKEVKPPGIEEAESSIDWSDFDARKAIIYAEILKRPEY